MCTQAQPLLRATSKNSTFEQYRRIHFQFFSKPCISLLRSLYSFLNRIAYYAQSKKIPQITYKAVFRSCLKQLINHADLYQLFKLLNRDFILLHFLNKSHSCNKHTPQHYQSCCRGCKISFVQQKSSGTPKKYNRASRCKFIKLSEVCITFLISSFA